MPSVIVTPFALRLVARQLWATGIGTTSRRWSHRRTATCGPTRMLKAPSIILWTPFLTCTDRGHSLHMFGDMVDTIVGMTSLAGGGHAMEGDVRYVSEERVRGAGAG